MTRPIKRVFVWIFGIAICSSLTGCATGRDPLTDMAQKLVTEKYRKQELVRVNQFNSADGINQGEAKLLGDVYFGEYISGCGYVEMLIQSGDQWSMDMIYGYTAKKLDEKIKVDMRTGRISSDYKGAPTIENPAEIISLYRKRLLNVV